MSNLIFEQIRVGGDRNLGYLFADRDKGVACVIDPSYSPQVFLERAEAQNLSISYVINTHGHFDHINGNEEICQKTTAQVLWWGSGDVALNEGDVIKIGDFSLKIMMTPGHSQDHIVLYNPEFKIAFTGDHLFVGKIGGTATEEQAREQYEGF